ncbi:hypothetical protein CBR_g11192 [Chara braunii]|uniref:Calcineurin-like phosphoesterase domain-containing protein n=1 Tax=Chara braunii TaxID=69332 RepID=A0A388KQF2_CHABU|nr:hypothetical protein CBR_g11192 [Chara braunii]|eukprot:GBG72262.1 hypothetical protein CBR_g11192 [Chara braunii]
MKLGFGPAIESGKPWAAILGNHDEEADLDRLGLMSYIAGMPFSYSKLNPSCVVAEDCDPVKGQFIVNGRNVSRDFRSCVSNIEPSANATKDDGDGDNDSILFQCNVDDATIIMGGVNGLPIVEGWGNYHLEIKGPEGSAIENDTALVLYLLDTGDKSKLDNRVQSAGKDDVPPALAFFHIPVPEYKQVAHTRTISGTWQEEICSPDVNSGFFTAMLEAGHIKAGFVGHDHVNDFCGTLHGLRLCYAGGAGYHGYGKLGWDRRARVVQVVMSNEEGKKMGVNPAGHQSMSAGTLKVRQMWTWKRLDDGYGRKWMTEKDRELLWELGRPTEDGKFPVFFLPCMVYQIATSIFTIIFLCLLVRMMCVKYRNRRNRQTGDYVLASTMLDNDMVHVLPQWRESEITGRQEREGSEL